MILSIKDKIQQYNYNFLHCFIPFYIVLYIYIILLYLYYIVASRNHVLIKAIKKNIFLKIILI